MIYIIKNTSDVTDEMLSLSLSNRQSLDGTKTILKWNGATPGIFKNETFYTVAEINTVMNKNEGIWNEIKDVGYFYEVN